MLECWHLEQDQRPDFKELLELFWNMRKKIEEETAAEVEQSEAEI